MSIEQELITILNQIPAAIEKALTEALVLRHPGHGSQKVHGNRYGAGQAKESLRRLKDDKGAREKYKETARKRTGTSGGGGGDTNPETWSKRLSKGEENALLEYAGSGYQRLNSGLRSGKLSKKDQETVKSLDSALSKSKLTKDTMLFEDTKLFRAADIPEVNAALKSGKLEGLEFTDKGFVSTTRDKNIANNFKRGENSRMFVINAPRGTRAGDLSSLEHGLSKESETLLARDTRFRVSRVEKVKEKYKFRGPNGATRTGTRTVEYIHMDVMGQG